MNSTGQAGFFVGGPAAEFCSTQLGFTLWDLVALFESWANQRDISTCSVFYSAVLTTNSDPGCMSEAAKRQECTKMIAVSLNKHHSCLERMLIIQ